jgi:hypothetical protein
MIFLIKKIKDFFEDFSRIFQEYFGNISPKAIKKQAGVALVIPFAHVLVLHFTTSCMFCTFNFMIVMHLQCCNCYALSNVMFLLHFLCGVHST